MATLSLNRINSIEAKASDLLQYVKNEKGEIQIPVNLGKIARSLNVSLLLAEFNDPNAIGYLDKNKQSIYVAKDTPAPRTAFTIAHELGHYILHNRQEDTYWRLDNLNLDKQDDTEETEANWFAASLLMPKKDVIKWWSTTHDVDKMASLFGVSKSAMTYRLSNLNLQ